MVIVSDDGERLKRATAQRGPDSKPDHTSKLESDDISRQNAPPVETWPILSSSMMCLMSVDCTLEPSAADGSNQKLVSPRKVQLSHYYKCARQHKRRLLYWAPPISARAHDLSLSLSLSLSSLLNFGGIMVLRTVNGAQVQTSQTRLNIQALLVFHRSFLFR